MQGRGAMRVLLLWNTRCGVRRLLLPLVLVGLGLGVVVVLVDT